MDGSANASPGETTIRAALSSKSTSGLRRRRNDLEKTGRSVDQLGFAMVGIEELMRQ
jgi:hypothetical protein